MKTYEEMIELASNYLSEGEQDLSCRSARAGYKAAIAEMFGKKLSDVEKDISTSEK